MRKIPIREVDIHREVGHEFLEMKKLGMRQVGEACLNCGMMRRTQGINQPCKGRTSVRMRSDIPRRDDVHVLSDNAVQPPFLAFPDTVHGNLPTLVVDEATFHTRGFGGAGARLGDTPSPHKSLGDWGGSEVSLSEPSAPDSSSGC